MKEELLTRYYVGLLIVAVVTLIFLVGILKSILYAILITIVKYLFDKYIMSNLNPYIDKFISWIKSKIVSITTTTTTTIKTL